MFELHHVADDHLAVADLLSLHETTEAAVAAALDHAAVRPNVVVSAAGGVVGQVDPTRPTKFTHSVLPGDAGTTRILIESLSSEPRFTAEYHVVPC